MKLPRKLKKEIIKCFGRGTYYGIIKNKLKIIPFRYLNRNGMITKSINYKENERYFFDNQVAIHKCINIK